MQQCSPTLTIPEPLSHTRAVVCPSSDILRKNLFVSPVNVQILCDGAVFTPRSFSAHTGCAPRHVSCCRECNVMAASRFILVFGTVGQFLSCSLEVFRSKASDPRSGAGEQLEQESCLHERLDNPSMEWIGLKQKFERFQLDIGWCGNWKAVLISTMWATVLLELLLIRSTSLTT